jgi:hypothetical protein
MRGEKYFRRKGTKENNNNLEEINFFCSEEAYSKKLSWKEENARRYRPPPRTKVFGRPTGEHGAPPS